jgi:hypothetical protein
MKSGVSANNPLVVLFIFFCFLIVPHHSHAGGIMELIDQGKEVIGGAIDAIMGTLPTTVGGGRTITIINETGYPLSGYSVNAASSDAEIRKAPSNDNFRVSINSSFNDYTEIEVVLVDRYGRIYAKTFDVPLDGNTQTPVTRADRKSEWFFKDRWKDIIAWFNEHK